MTLEQRTIQELQELGMVADRVDGYLGPKRSHDWLGFVDVLAFRPEHPRMMAVQVTSRTNISARVRKILDDHHEVAAALVQSGHQLEVWGWDHPKRGLWRIRRIGFVLVERDSNGRGNGGRVLRAQSIEQGDKIVGERLLH